LLKRNPHYVGEKYSKDYMYNLYKKPYVKWKIECEEHDLDREKIFEETNDVEDAWYWQSILNIICMANLIITGIMLGVINWVLTLYRLTCATGPITRLGKIWDQTTNYIVIIFGFIELMLVFI